MMNFTFAAEFNEIIEKKVHIIYELVEILVEFQVQFVLKNHYVEKDSLL